MLGNACINRFYSVYSVMEDNQLSILNDPRLNLAYKYPFSSDAKGIISKVNAGLEQRFLKGGELRINEALSSKSISFVKVNLSYLKYAYLMSYIYARMLISAVNSREALVRYINAESKRAVSSLANDSPENFMKIANQLNSKIAHEDDLFLIRFEEFLKIAPKIEEFSLEKQQLQNGIIYLKQGLAARLLTRIIKTEIGKNLPIPAKELPVLVVDYAKKLKLPSFSLTSGAKKSLSGTRYEWIERLLSNPIQDVRHRTVNLILAPYLTNVRGMGEEDAANIIINYIERCKEIDSNTRINATYIRYQCKYAKRKGLRPLSLDRAKELLGGMVSIAVFNEVSK